MNGTLQFDIDAKFLYPRMQNIHSILGTIWEKIYAQIPKIKQFPLLHLMQYTSEGRIFYFKIVILYFLFHSPFIDSKKLLSLISLPYLFPTIYIKKNNKSTRLSKAEFANKFYPYFEVIMSMLYFHPCIHQ